MQKKRFIAVLLLFVVLVASFAFAQSSNCYVAPTVSVSPNPVSVARGSAGVESVTITNNAPASCGTRTYSLEASCGNLQDNCKGFSNKYPVVSPGASNTVTLTINVATNDAVGNHNIKVSAVSDGASQPTVSGNSVLTVTSQTCGNRVAEGNENCDWGTAGTSNAFCGGNGNDVQASTCTTPIDCMEKINGYAETVTGKRRCLEGCGGFVYDTSACGKCGDGTIQASFEECDSGSTTTRERDCPNGNGKQTCNSQTCKWIKCNEPPICVDDDGDKYGVAGKNAGCPKTGDDCNDNDIKIHPGATEVCNSKDDNCNGQTDENLNCGGPPPDKCSDTDKTPVGQCSGTNRPKYCDSTKTLVDKCGTCGCPGGTCKADGTCSGACSVDGVQNQGETGVDCGGPKCPACTSNCGNNVVEGTEDCDGTSMGRTTRCTGTGGGFIGPINAANPEVTCVAPGPSNQCEYDTSNCKSAGPVPAGGCDTIDHDTSPACCLSSGEKWIASGEVRDPSLGYSDAAASGLFSGLTNTAEVISLPGLSLRGKRLASDGKIGSGDILGDDGWLYANDMWVPAVPDHWGSCETCDSDGCGFIDCIVQGTPGHWKYNAGQMFQSIGPNSIISKYGGGGLYKNWYELLVALKGKSGLPEHTLTCSGGFGKVVSKNVAYPVDKPIDVEVVVANEKVYTILLYADYTYSTSLGNKPVDSYRPKFKIFKTDLDGSNAVSTAVNLDAMPSQQQPFGLTAYVLRGNLVLGWQSVSYTCQRGVTHCDRSNYRGSPITYSTTTTTLPLASLASGAVTSYTQNTQNPTTHFLDDMFLTPTSLRWDSVPAVYNSQVYTVSVDTTKTEISASEAGYENFCVRHSSKPDDCSSGICKCLELSNNKYPASVLKLNMHKPDGTIVTMEDYGTFGPKVSPSTYIYFPTEAVVVGNKIYVSAIHLSPDERSGSSSLYVYDTQTNFGGFVFGGEGPGADAFISLANVGNKYVYAVFPGSTAMKGTYGSDIGNNALYDNVQGLGIPLGRPHIAAGPTKLYAASYEGGAIKMYVIDANCAYLLPPSKSTVDSQYASSARLPPFGTGFCLGDDDADRGFVRSRDCAAGVCQSDPLDAAACDKASDCVYNGVCYSDVDEVAKTYFNKNVELAKASAWSAETLQNVNANAALETCDPGQWMGQGGQSGPTGTAAGTVTDTATGLGLASAAVSAVGTSNQQLTYSATTAADGAYTISAMEPANYDFTASKVDYITGTQNNLPVLPFQTTTVNFQLTPQPPGGVWSAGGGNITGRVTNVSGSPVAGAVVKVQGTALTATTAADGSYTILNVPSGFHDLTASKPSDGYEDASSLSTEVTVGIINVDFTLLRALGGCENDCTLVDSNSCDASCHGKGQCLFYSEETMQACDGTFGIIGLSGGRSVSCCEGQPYQQVKADATINAKNIVRTEKLVVYQGKIVKMVTLVFNPDN